MWTKKNSNTSFTLVIDEGNPNRYLDVAQRLSETASMLSATIEIDAFSDIDPLPEHIYDAREILRSLDLGRTGFLGRKIGPTYMNIVVQATNDHAIVKAAVIFAPYSIHAEFIANGNNILTLHDSGQSISISETLLATKEISEYLRSENLRIIN